MYKITIVAMLAAIAFTTSFAQQSESTTPGASKQDMDKRWQQMQEQMKQMHTQMEQIQKSKDPKERERLMQEHMQSMREHMDMMHDTGGCMMMGPMERADQGGATRSERGGMGCGMMMESDPKRREQLLERRMDMMQMMMEQMMQHQEAMQQKQK